MPHTFLGIRPGSAVFLFLFIVLVMSGCKGPEGPAGPPGPAGPGSRKVYSGTITAAADSTGQFVDLPDLNLADFPIVAVYISDQTGDWIQLNLVIYNPNTANFPFFEVAILRTGSITIFSGAVGQPYRIVVVY